MASFTRPTAASDENTLSYDTIICSIAAKYKGYNTNVVRSLFIDPTPDQKAAYLTALHALEALMQSLKPGVVIKDAYNKVIDFIKQKDATLVDKLLNYLGFGIGLEFKENVIAITGKCERVIEAGMVFCAIIGLNNLTTAKGKQYAIMVADTVVVKDQDGNNEVVTKGISKKFDDISYSLQENEPPPAPAAPAKSAGRDERQTKARVAMEELRDGRRNLRSTDARRKNENDEKHRKAHQAELAKQKDEQINERWRTGTLITSKRDQKMSIDQLTSYNSPEEFPKTMKKNQINIDEKNFSIIVPVFGQMVPFHVSVLKNVTKSEEGKTSTVRLNFHVPGGSSTLSNLRFPDIKHPNSCFLRELTFKSTNGAQMGNLVKVIKELQKKARLAVEEKLESEEMKEQEPLILIKGSKPILPEILIRPVLSGKKSVGTLECHQNGLRFYTKQGKKVDISFSNIKYAFYQPGEGDMMALLHFNLKVPVIVGEKKKTQDIQFYTELGIQAEDIDFRRKPMNDDDEIEQEEREKMAQKKLNEQFRNFSEQVEKVSKGRLEFDIPVKDLGFNGSPNRSNVFLMPSEKCLVNLTETPYFIMPIDELELAHFERVQFRLKNFDLSFVFKDYNKQVIRINAIPTESLENLKNWLEYSSALRLV